MHDLALPSFPSILCITCLRDAPLQSAGTDNLCVQMPNRLYIISVVMRSPFTRNRFSRNKLSQASDPPPAVTSGNWLPSNAETAIILGILATMISKVIVCVVGLSERLLSVTTCAIVFPEFELSPVCKQYSSLGFEN